MPQVFVLNICIDLINTNYQIEVIVEKALHHHYQIPTINNTNIIFVK